jgi:hypothetical protein
MASQWVILRMREKVLGKNNRGLLSKKGNKGKAKSEELLHRKGVGSS